MNLREIGEDLNAVYLVTGSIEEIGNKIRVRAQLIDSRDENTVWADDYTKSNVEVFDLHTELATQIVSALKTKITPEEKKGLYKKYTDNIEAYKYYVRGRNFWNARGRTNFDSAETNFRKAVSIDHQYALAYAGIADCYTYNFKGMAQLDAIQIARENANIALSIDSNLSEGLTTIGFIEHNYDYEWEKSKATLQKAISLDPNNSLAHLYYGNVLQYTGHTEQGLEEGEKAVALDPLAFGANWVLGRNYYFARKDDLALKQFEKTEGLGQNSNGVIYWSLGLVYLAKSMNKEALEQYEKVPDNAENPIDNVDVMKSYGYAATGNKARAKTVLEKAIKKDLHASAYRIAQAYIALGEMQTALNWLDEGYRVRDLHMFWVKVDPSLDPIRATPKFQELLKKMKLLP